MIKLCFSRECLLQLITYNKWLFQNDSCKEEYKREAWKIRGKAIQRLMKAMKWEQEAYGCADRAFPAENWPSFG